ncbi:MAG TPA: acyltransferase [Acidimicrobiales bacterium]|nr:acyltransferase [Acidimicrobiales bacterium]
MSRALSLGFEVRRLVLVARLRVLAALKRADLDVVIDRGVRIEGRVLVRVHGGTRTRVRIGRGTRIGDSVRLVLDGGELVVGERVLLRTGVVLHVRGRLTLEDECLLSYYSVVHCDEEVHVGGRVGLGEHTTISDSTHVTPPPGDWWYHHIATAPVRLGARTWGGAKVTITRGVDIGADAVLAAGSVVTSDVPAGMLSGGMPARVLGPSPLSPASPDRTPSGG